MRVTIEHYDAEGGLIFKKKRYGVAASVSFTEVEKEIIRSADLGRDVLYKFKNTPPEWRLNMDWLRTYNFFDDRTVKVSFPIYEDATYYEESLTAALKKLKANIDANDPKKPTKKTIEL